MKSYDDILNFVLGVGSNSLEVFGGKYKGGYELQQRPQEISEFLYDFQSINFNNFLEIGTAAAGNTRLLCDFIEINNIYTIDLNVHPSINWSDNPNARDKNLSSLKNKGSLINYYGDSHSKETKDWLYSLNVKFDLAFIDGDHSFEGVKQDFELVMPLLNNGAIVVFHDTACVSECKQMNDIVKSGKYSNFTHYKDYLFGDKNCSCVPSPMGIGVHKFTC
jgi:predicted O-methyltransferase YrrM